MLAVIVTVGKEGGGSCGSATWHGPPAVEAAGGVVGG